MHRTPEVACRDVTKNESRFCAPPRLPWNMNADAKIRARQGDRVTRGVASITSVEEGQEGAPNLESGHIEGRSIRCTDDFGAGREGQGLRFGMRGGSKGRLALRRDGVAPSRLRRNAEKQGAARTAMHSGTVPHLVPLVNRTRGLLKWTWEKVPEPDGQEVVRKRIGLVGNKYLFPDCVVGSGPDSDTSVDRDGRKDGPASMDGVILEEILTVTEAMQSSKCIVLATDPVQLYTAEEKRSFRLITMGSNFLEIFGYRSLLLSASGGLLQSVESRLLQWPTEPTKRAARILYLNTGIGGEPKFEMGGFGLEKQLREVRGSVEQQWEQSKRRHLPCLCPSSISKYGRVQNVMGMSLTPEISEEISLVSGSHKTEYIHLGFYSFFLYYYVTTVAMEVKFMWPRKWHWGKVLFLVNRYLPMVVYSANFLTVWRVYIILSPKACTVLVNIFTTAFYRVYGYSAEVTLILCLHALLGALPLYLTPIMATYLALTLAANLIQIGNLAETSRNYLEALPLSEFDRELGYACTWAGSISAANAKKGIFALALFIFMVRYRKQTGTFKLFHVLRRDSGVYILLLAVIRLGSAIAGAFQLKLGWYSIPDEVLSALNGAVVPILANRLLLNMWKTQDPDVRKSVSSILFDPPRPGEDSDDDDEEFADRPIEMMRYKGLGRRRAAAREANEGTLQGGAGGTQAAENREDVSGYGTRTWSWAHSFVNKCHSLV
ncbi:hypothetical protein DFP72DRAFT_1048534 [Ephemerocybe angulata]|uniref:DUF6533 domain-containing protein n=1 Tax=Ephemerocybe angulata TaxID=980116 RepID=A0A8H6HPE9_9AGAR|nr:hypothetical protein DFP72DRAFT_1048534 [Tulosesus angulatus]